MDKEITERWFDAIGTGGEALRALILGVEQSPEALADGLEEQEWAMVTFLDGVTEGRIEGGPPITQTDIDRVRRLRGLVERWPPHAPPSPEMLSLAEQLICWFFGPNWQTELRPRHSA